MIDADPTRGLPPKPDPETGHPRPPHAPNFIGNRRAAGQDPDRENRSSAKPEPPDGQGPVLAWYRSSRRGAWSAAIIGVVLIVGILFLIKGMDVRILETWWVWLVAILAAIGMYFSTKKSWCAAGADWFTFQKSWVDIYDLVEIKTRFISNTIYIYLTDADGRKVEAPINIIQQDRLIWDLLYNGIRHSIAKGAELKGTARNYFHTGLANDATEEHPPGGSQ
jgi:hypothetical protein